MTVRAVLFDVGGPINTEVEHERAIDDDIRSLFAEAGREISDERYAEAWRRVVESFAPNAYQAVIFALADRDDVLADSVYREMASRSHARGSFEVREGVPQLLGELNERGLLLGLAANQPAEAIGRLQRFGLAGYFDSQLVSDMLGYHKPDVRLFLDVCKSLGVEPADCIMVGDRIDCDVVPVKRLGMRTVLLRTGRHIAQRPRTWMERPDAEVTDVPGMREAILRMLE